MGINNNEQVSTSKPADHIYKLFVQDGVRYLVPTITDVPQPPRNDPDNLIDLSKIDNLNHTESKSVPVFSMHLPYLDLSWNEFQEPLKQMKQRVGQMSKQYPEFQKMASILDHQEDYAFRGVMIYGEDAGDNKLISISRYGLDYYPGLAAKGVCMSIGEIREAMFHFVYRKSFIDESVSRQSMLLIYRNKGLKYLRRGDVYNLSTAEITDNETLRDKLEGVLLVNWSGKRSISKKVGALNALPFEHLLAWLQGLMKLYQKEEEES